MKKAQEQSQILGSPVSQGNFCSLTPCQRGAAFTPSPIWRISLSCDKTHFNADDYSLDCQTSPIATIIPEWLEKDSEKRWPDPSTIDLNPNEPISPI